MISPILYMNCSTFSVDESILNVGLARGSSSFGKNGLSANSHLEDATAKWPNMDVKHCWWWQPWVADFYTDILHRFVDGSRGAREFHRPCLTHGREGQWANVQAEHMTLAKIGRIGIHSGGFRELRSLIHPYPSLSILISVSTPADPSLSQFIHLTSWSQETEFMAPWPWSRKSCTSKTTTPGQRPNL